ncbi:MAG: hypothetical protein ACRCUY_08590, partial [Thermoguttaceae bacterium]
DYLNDDVTENGDIDYSLTEKLPKRLREAIKDGKKILVLMNPPYAEATNVKNATHGATAGNKTGVAKTKFAATGGMNPYGKASNELFTQFLARIAKEIPKATIATFSKLKYLNSPNFEQFRQSWNATYLGGFMIHSKVFDGLKGDFPIGFLIWQTNQKAKIKTPITEIQLDVFDKNVSPIGEKTFYNLPAESYLNKWVMRPRANQEEVVPLSNFAVPTTGNPWIKTWSENAVGYMCAGTNDLQNASKFIYLLSSVASRGHGFYVNAKNLWQAAIVFSVSKIIKHTWINDRDQFLQPTEKLPSEFKNDCLIWMLFNGSNLTASANNLEWNGKKWSIVNHFIPFSEAEVGATGRFESDFMKRYMSDKKFSRQSQVVLNAGRELWKAYFSHTDGKATRDQFCLNRSDVGWYQVRSVLKARNESGDFASVSFAAFEKAYNVLTEKLRPQVYEYGFLR